MAETADTLREHLRREAPGGVVSVYLFGSEARGATHADSDVDVGVVLDREAHPDRADRARAGTRLAADLIAATHRNDLDLAVLNDVSPELAAAVVREGRRVYCADEEADRRFARRAAFRWADLRPWLRRMRRIKAEALAR